MIMKIHNYKALYQYSFILIVLLGVSCSNAFVYQNTDDIQSILDNFAKRNIVLDNIVIEKQPNASTCGITAVTVVSNYVNEKNQTVDNLIKKYKVNTSKGTSVDDIRTWLKGELSDKTVEYHSNGKNVETINNIYESLSNNKPVIVFFGSSNDYNKPYYDFHASVIYGLNADMKTIKIANSYGYSEDTTLVDFMNRMNFTEIDKYPSSQQFIIKMGLIDKNMYFIVK
jgi:hypothetical protein